MLGQGSGLLTQCPPLAACPQQPGATDHQGLASVPGHQAGRGAGAFPAEPGNMILLF